MSEVKAPLAPKLVVLESPYAGDVNANVAYARAAARQCAAMNEAVQASHLLYTQFLNDADPAERALGMRLGLAWLRVADYSAFFTDRGWSRGMTAALQRCHEEKRAFRLRSLYSTVQIPHSIERFCDSGIIDLSFSNHTYITLS